MEFRVYLRLEGIPPHAWGQDVAAMVLGRSCAIHFVEEHTRRRERTRSYDLWAWCADPSKIPKRVWLTISDPDAEQQPTNIPLPRIRVHRDEPTDTKHGLTYKVLPHVEVVEDLSFLNNDGGQGGPPNRKPRRRFIWSYGEEDSQGEVRREGGRGRNDYRRRDDHDHDEDHGGRHRRHRSASAWGRVTRCRSGAVDCYSSNIRAFNNNYGGSFRSRNLKWEPKTANKSQKDAKVAPAPTTKIVEPLPCIMEAEENMMEMQPNMDVGKDFELNIINNHLPKPLNKPAMEAMGALIEQGNKMNKKAAKTKAAASKVAVRPSARVK